MSPWSQLRSKEVNVMTESILISGLSTKYRSRHPARILRAPRSLAALTLLFCSSTLMCCALPAALVMIGAGSVLASLLSWLPAIVVLSQHKLTVFGIAGVSLLVAGFVLQQSSRMPCSLDPALARRCRHRLNQGRKLYALSCTAFMIGGFCAFILPILHQSS